MKKLRPLVLSLLVALTATVASADCLNAFNNDINTCENTMGGLTEVGCKMDAVVDYYACVGRAATS
jgi:hypothetical protein